MRILIGYSMRSGSTLLQHILGQHSAVRSYSDLNSLPAQISAWLGLQPRGYRLIKPLDLFYLMPGTRLFNHSAQCAQVAPDSLRRPDHRPG